MATQQYTFLEIIEQGCHSEFALNIITSKKELKALATAIKKAESVCINVQGTDMNPTLSAFAGMSLAINATDVYFIPRQSNEQESSLSVTEVAAELSSIFASTTIEKVMYNRSFNEIILAQNNMPVSAPIFNIAIATSLIIHAPQEEINALLQNFYYTSADTSYKNMQLQEETSKEPIFVEKNLWHTIANTHQTIFLRDILKNELQCLVDNIRTCKH